MDRLKIQELYGYSVLRVRGFFKGWHYRNGVLIGEHEGENLVTIVGKNHMLDVTFGNSSPVTQVATWYMGLINATPAPSIVEGDTLASHTGWDEITSYSGNRKAWVDANASNKNKLSTSASSFTLTADVTIYGAMICSVDTGTSGILWCAGAYTTPAVMENGDVFQATYGIRT